MSIFGVKFFVIVVVFFGSIEAITARCSGGAGHMPNGVSGQGTRLHQGVGGEPGSSPPWTGDLRKVIFYIGNLITWLISNKLRKTRQTGMKDTIIHFGQIKQFRNHLSLLEVRLPIHFMK